MLDPFLQSFSPLCSLIVFSPLSDASETAICQQSVQARRWRITTGEQAQYVHDRIKCVQKAAVSAQSQVWQIVRLMTPRTAFH